VVNSELLVILQKYLPEGSADYAHDILWKYGIQLRIKKPRATKLGDYRPPQPGEAHRISINKDLNKYAFLVTFLHETAHLINFEKRGFKVQPHGLEWKQEFQVVTKPMLHETILPNDVQGALQRYLKNPKASSCTDPFLFKTLRNYDDRPDHMVLVESVPMQTLFKTKDGRVFRKLEKMRSRYRCVEDQTGKIYLVPGLLEVEIVI
jgi:SprT protein